MPPRNDKKENRKQADLASVAFRVEDKTLTTDHGVPIPHTDDSLRAGLRGPSLIEDFHLREKITRFDHERIPERVVHARGSAAHGYFQVYESLADLTAAKFLQEPARRTPVFVRFSTVAGSRGSADTVRDVRGFATKFYTDEGNFDLVGNNIPVFFIQDGIKFPDVIHAVKPEPHHEMPQAASAHDTFWDFISLVPESAHMVMWAMSDRAIPRSYRMMEGFGVHTFRLVNARGKSTFVKFHWKPALGACSLVWDEALRLNGLDPDFHRRDLWETIASGEVVEYELGLQVISEKDASKLPFDLLDPTKLIPEETIPVRIVGKMTLNRNPDNFFAETEQVAFCVSNLVPGIDVTNDPLLQARLFSYLDTQLTRLGGPNFAQIPINRPIAPVANHQQDGFHQQKVATTQANYHPNSIGGGCPFLAHAKEGYVHFPEPLEGTKIRRRSDSFADHFTQATLFLHSQSPRERQHMIKACRFELGKVTRKKIRQRVVDLFAQIDPAFARDVALGIGVTPPKGGKSASVEPSPALSLMAHLKPSIATRRIAVLCAPGVDSKHVNGVRSALEEAGAVVEIIAPVDGEIPAINGAKKLAVTKALPTVASVLYDAVFVPGGAASVQALKQNRGATFFVEEAFLHGKAMAACGDGAQLLTYAIPSDAPRDGVVTHDKDPKALAKLFIPAIAAHRHWSREGWGIDPPDLQAKRA